MILHIETAEVCGPYQLRVRFNSGIERCVDLSQILVGPVFGPLRDAGLFAQAYVDPVCQTVVWPNGADLAPEALLELPAMEVSAAERA